jgi:HD-like signal output (HDOD) protein
MCMTPELERHIKTFVNFPTPPGVAAHIIELAQDSDIEMGKVAKAVSVDPALSTKILRIANSPLYAQRRKSENLRQALVVLGLNATLTLAARQKAERHRLSVLLAPRPDRRHGRPRSGRSAPAAARRGTVPRRTPAGCGHAGA